MKQVVDSNWIYWVALLLCCVIMTVIDYFLGERAEYLNAWSMVVKLFRLPFEVPTSRIMQQYGVGGELLAVLLVNGAIGFILVRLIRLGLRFGRQSPCE